MELSGSLFPLSKKIVSAARYGGVELGRGVLNRCLNQELVGIGGLVGMQFQIGDGCSQR